MFSVSAQPNPMPIAPSIWPRHCIGLMSRPMSAACTLCRMRISRGHAMHREPHALDVEGDRARRQIGLALGLEAVAGLGAGDVEVGQRDPLVAADHHAVVETAVGGAPRRCDGWRSRGCCRARPLAVRFTAWPATTVPVLANVPVS